MTTVIAIAMTGMTIMIDMMMIGMTDMIDGTHATIGETTTATHATIEGITTTADGILLKTTRATPTRLGPTHQHTRQGTNHNRFHTESELPHTRQGTNQQLDHRYLFQMQPTRALRHTMPNNRPWQSTRGKQYHG